MDNGHPYHPSSAPRLVTAGMFFIPQNCSSSAALPSQTAPVWAARPRSSPKRTAPPCADQRPLEVDAMNSRLASIQGAQKETTKRARAPAGPGSNQWPELAPTKETLDSLTSPRLVRRDELFFGAGSRKIGEKSLLVWGGQGVRTIWFEGIRHHGNSRNQMWRTRERWQFLRKKLHRWIRGFATVSRCCFCGFGRKEVGRKK